LLRVLPLAVSPLRRVTFFKRQKSNQKRWAPAFGTSLWLGVPSFRDSSGGIAYGLLRCTSSRCMRLRRTVAALPPPDKSLHSAFRRGQKIKSFTRANAHRVEWWEVGSGKQEAGSRKQKVAVYCLIVPTLRVGMQPGTLRVPSSNVQRCVGFTESSHLVSAYLSEAPVLRWSLQMEQETRPRPGFLFVIASSQY